MFHKPFGMRLKKRTDLNLEDRESKLHSCKEMAGSSLIALIEARRFFFASKEERFIRKLEKISWVGEVAATSITAYELLRGAASRSQVPFDAKEFN